MAMTYGDALALAGVPVPAHLEASAEVPVLTGVQFQGDLAVVPVPLAYAAGATVPVWPAGEVLPPEGVQVVHGEATGNTHWLHPGFGAAGVRWHRAALGLVTGVVTVPDGETAFLVHTDEHGANGIGPGAYEIRRKREQHDEIALIAD